MLLSFGSVMLNVLYVVIAIVVLLTMVLIHELGHYTVGRLLGFKITEFSIGFGKAIWQKRNKRGELISLRVFPLGGYCAFYGEGEEDDGKSNQNQLEQKSEMSADSKGSESLSVNFDENAPKFNDHGPFKRILVFLAGVTFNFISAFIFSILFLCVGAYDGYLMSPTQGYTVTLYSSNTNEIVQTLENDTPVYAINGTKINYAYGNVYESLTSENDTKITFTVLLDGEEQEVYITRATKDDKYGISFTASNFNYNFGCVLRDFVPFTLRISVLILNALWMIITGAIAFNQLGGPISTITQISAVASIGFANFLYLLPLLAANLAIFNLIPIPGLDGAHVIFATIELIRGKPIKRELENAIHMWGIILLFAFVVIIDVVHLLTA